MKVRQKSVPAFIVGLISGILGLIGAILSSLSSFGIGLVVSIPLLLLPSILIIIGSIICLFKAKVGGIIISVAFGLYFIGIVIMTFGWTLLSIIAFPVISAALILAFVHPKAAKIQAETINSDEIAVNDTELAAKFNDTVKHEITTSTPTTNSLSILGLIFSFFMPILGLLFGITGLRDAKKYHSGRGAGMGLSAIIISSVIIFSLLMVLLFAFI